MGYRNRWKCACKSLFILARTELMFLKIAAVNNEGKNQVFRADKGDIWYFPKGQGHVIQGITDPGAEYLLVFDDGDFDAKGRTFNVADWIVHTPLSVLAKNFGRE